MSEIPNQPNPDAESNSGSLVPELSQKTLDTYARLWQFETWLRRLVYVELRALVGDGWALKVSGAQKPKERDKRLTHMPTPEENLLSYSQLSELRSIISEHWRLFESFLPPQHIWDAKLDEISQIRHRVAHFRTGHHDDLQRVTQLLRDIDQGFWRFCTSFNQSGPVLPQSDDPIEARFLHLDQFPWSPVGENKWARIGSADPSARLGVTVEVICRPWAKWETPIIGKEGFLYCLRTHGRHNRVFDYKRLLEQTRNIHKHIVYICLERHFNAFEITLPAILGESQIIQIVKQVLDDALSCCLTTSVFGQGKANTAQSLADEWPEYVLGPENPLTFLGPDMPCSFFEA
jgi:HEPN superfamily Swt1-like protein